MSRTIMFTFWGRKPNIELQLPYIARILDENPDIEVQAWNLTQRDKTGDDDTYIRTINIDRLVIRDDFLTARSTSQGQNQVWQHYARTEYRGATFIKLDDDTIFLEARRAAEFAQTAASHPTHIISALTVNNGCSARHIPAVWDIFKRLEPGMRADNTPDPELAKLLAVHRCGQFAQECHRWFHTNWETLANRPGELIPTDDWLSINAIALSWPTLRQIALRIGRRSPQRVVAGRPLGTLGDEGAANLHPRMIYTGFVAAHLTFGPQQHSDANPDGMDPELVGELRKLYADISRQYLT